MPRLSLLLGLVIASPADARTVTATAFLTHDLHP